MSESDNFYKSIYLQLDEYKKKKTKLSAEELKKDIGARIRIYQDMHNLTQAELADRLNVSLRQLIRWKAGQSYPTKLGFKAMAELGILKKE